MNNNIAVLKEFIHTYFISTDSLYYSLPEEKRQNRISREYLSYATEVSAVILHVASKLELAKYVDGDDYENHSVKYLQLDEEAEKQLANEIKFICLSKVKPFVEEAGKPNFALVAFGNLSIIAALESANRKVFIDEILNNTPNE